MTAHHETRRARPDSNLSRWLLASFFGFITLCCVAAVWSVFYGTHARDEDMRTWQSWPSTKGTPIGTRVIKDWETARALTVGRFNGSSWYEGECHLQYSVTGKPYSIWVVAYEDSDPKWVADRMTTCPFP